MTARAFLLAALVLTVAAGAGSCGAGDRVGCYVQREFRRRGSLIKVWGCRRVAGGILTHDLACVSAGHGRPLTPAEQATIPARRLRCSV